MAHYQKVENSLIMEASYDAIGMLVATRSAKRVSLGTCVQKEPAPRPLFCLHSLLPQAKALRLAQFAGDLAEEGVD